MDNPDQLFYTFRDIQNNRWLCHLFVVENCSVSTLYLVLLIFFFGIIFLLVIKFKVYSFKIWCSGSKLFKLNDCTNNIRLNLKMYYCLLTVKLLPTRLHDCTKQLAIHSTFHMYGSIILLFIYNIFIGSIGIECNVGGLSPQKCP